MPSLTLAPLSNFDIGAVVAALIAVIAYRVRSLDAGGALAAFCIGTATYGAFAVPGASVLLAFFISSVTLSRAGGARKRARLREVGKSGARDASQVMANGAVAAVAALLALWVDGRYAVAFAGAFAAATADTWGTEIGTLRSATPRSMFTGKPVDAGLSGGVTWMGTLAECAGALFLASVAVTLVPHAFAAVAAGGIAGALVDSALGASLQSLRWCPQCRRATEREPHTCGANTAHVRGLAWLGNDSVNAAATFTGAIVAFALAR